MIIKENLEQINSWPNKNELISCREFWVNNSNILVATFDTLSKSKDFIDSRLNNLSSRILG